MVIEIKPKTGIKKNWWKILLLIFSIILFLFLLVSYFYIDYLFKEISREINNKEAFLSRSPAEKTLEQELSLYEEKIEIFKELLLSHKKPLNIFLLLEQMSHPNIWFSSFNFDSFSGSISVKGEAKNFIDIGQQLIILKENENFEEVELISISMGDEGRVNFSLSITLNQELLKNAPQ